MSDPIPKTRAWPLSALLGAFLGGALTVLALNGLAEQNYTWGEQYRTIPTAYQKMIDDSERAFTQRDVAVSGEALAEDFSWYPVTEEGPKEMVRGKGATLARLKIFFASPLWTTNDSEVHRLGMIGNTLVQVEIDTLQMNGKPVSKTSLHVYEFKDGKRWREFVFYPTPS